MDLITIKGKDLAGKVNTLNSELCELAYKDKQIMWGGGKPQGMKSEVELRDGAWQHSEIIMFPIVGSVKNSTISVSGTNYPMGQHGISRYIPFEKLSGNSKSMV